MSADASRTPPPDVEPISESAEVRESDANQLASYLQSTIEVERSRLARLLHDDLGGLLVGALMDVAWVEARLQAPDLQAKLARARDSLRAAVDLKRNLIETMRPTLLENVGIFAAVRWHFAKYCDADHLTCTASISGAEPTLRSTMAIGVYRIIEEALQLISGPLKARLITMEMKITGTDLQVQILHDGAALSPEQLASLPEFKSMAHRISTLQGKYTVTGKGENLLEWDFLVPIEAPTH